jgi:hypothetical protein
MRAADDFAVIRARLTELERERQWAAHRHERAIQEDELDRMDFRAVQRAKEEMKTKIIERNRRG